MKKTTCVEYDKCYEFYDKKTYDEKLTKLYMLTDTISAKTLADLLNEPEAAVQKAIQQMVIPIEWLMKAFFYSLRDDSKPFIRW